MKRRSFLAAGAASLLTQLSFRARAAGARPQVTSCIMLWMNGGPSHCDTFDIKPSSRFHAIPTSSKDIMFCEHLPQLATQAHHLAVIRSMTSREGNHERARHLLHTGYAPTPTVNHPSLGAWVSEELSPPALELPEFVSINGPSHDAGFLGAQYNPFVIPKVSQPLSNINYARQVDAARFDRRMGLLDRMESNFFASTRDAKVSNRQEVYRKAVRLMRAPTLEAFKLDKESATVRAAYGDTDFGRGCLLARRLVEARVPFIEVMLDGWDTHKDNFTRTQSLMTTVDPAMATLLKELAERDVLQHTLVVWMGDFGRSPVVNANEGRDHHPKAFSVVMAGGAMRGGSVYGQTDGTGTNVVANETRVADLFATIAVQMGLDPDKTVNTPLGRPLAMTEHGSPLSAIMKAT